MTRTEPNFLSEEGKIVEQPKRKKRTISKIIIYLLIIFVILGIFFGIGVITSGENLAKTLGNTSLWGQLKFLIGSDDKKLLGEDEDRINILLLGMGGLDHDGPFLTDTIIVASYKPSTDQVAMLSVPRDLLVQIPNYGWRKINHANAFGELDNPGQGAELTKKVISQVFNIPIHYYVRIDFAGFKQVIDDLGGVTVEVENTVDDPQYPIKGKETATTSERYEHLYIEPGRVKMDGDLALKFVRSRHAKGIEGSDFARSKRQQKVLLAAKEKALSFGTLANPYKIGRLMDTLSQHLATDLKAWEIIRLFNLGKDVDEEKITRRIFDDGPDGVLYSSVTADGAFVLQPKAGNFSEMQLIAQNIFEPEKLVAMKPKLIEIQNGTKIGGLAYEISQYLESLGYQVIKIGNAPTQDYQKTVVYNRITEAEDTTAQSIAQLLTAELAPTLPDWVKSTTTPKVNVQTDILIILGQDRKNP
ncbi:MAG: LCP family protein [Candidatus Buchananbacteria bacterium]|nr:LCP family protein [Candidatus Buchananbacteria bacterium]